jgi:hypothetical protein
MQSVASPHTNFCFVGSDLSGQKISHRPPRSPVLHLKLTCGSHMSVTTVLISWKSRRYLCPSSLIPLHSSPILSVGSLELAVVG